MGENYLFEKVNISKEYQKERIRNMTGETLEQFYMRKLPELRRKKGVTRKDVAAGVGDYPGEV